MNYFKITVLRKGKKEFISIYAKDKRDALSIVKNSYDGIIIKIEISQEDIDKKLKRLKDKLLYEFNQKKIKQDSLIASIRQLAVMSNASISIYDALEEISNSSDDKTLKYIFKKLSDDINSGSSLSSSMQNFRYEIGDLSITMVQLGEKTGKLDEALYSLADMLEEIRANIIKFKKAISYPRNVLVTMAIAFSILISFVIPQFKSIFDQYHAQLPLPTKLLLGLEYLFNNFGFLIFFIILISFYTFKYIVRNNQNFRYKLHKLLLKIYLIKDVLKYSTLSRFTLVFSKLLSSGIPIIEALDTSIEMIDILPIKKKLLLVKHSVEKGSTLHKGLKETNLFENMIIQMIKAGEESGTLDSMTDKIAQYYKMRFDAIIDGLTEAIEPLLLLIMAILITVLALGIFMPMWNLGDALKIH
jgi:general secretion pathway protein F